ncbi:MAG TPA: hypothetical protein PK765_05010 [bacterium]|nr:hypothetical protein [bacterium]
MVRGEFEVLDLSAHDPHIAHGICEQADRLYGAGIGEKFKREGIESVSHEHGYIGSVRLPDCRLPPTHRIIVHLRQIVVHECVGMHALDRYGGSQDIR